MITGKTLKKRGWKEGRTIGLAKMAAHALEPKGLDETQILARLDEVLADPQRFLGDPVFTPLADELIRRARNDKSKFDDALRSSPIPFQIWGQEGIDAGAIEQMNNAALLPIAVAGALMPDAHIGYGLPIGGVLATRGAVIPYAVGVDIACFSGTTRVPLADGKDYSLRELAERNEPFVVYSCSPSGRVQAAWATAHLTKKDAALLEVELDNGEKVRCTPDHEWMLRDGTFLSARELKEGTSLMPFYSKRDKENYTLVQQNDARHWQEARELERALRIFSDPLVYEREQTQAETTRYNHKVVSVREVAGREDVFCLNVPGWENFALSAGVFVHNCRMRLSIYEASPHILGQQKGKFENSLRDQTRFGAGCKWDRGERKAHDVLDDPDWNAFGLLRKLRFKAEEQLGTSGSGNHFVEWGELELQERSEDLGLDKGTYLALLSHSGSRGVGFKIAGDYSRAANALHPGLADKVRHLAWLDLDSEAGQEYWIGMELAGRFAAANHYVIHHEVAKAAGLKEIAAVENHHNFAWKEMMEDGEEAIVHRKGATPAGEGVLGIIPGSMADAGYVVRGKGLASSLSSASHGAGRKLGRKAAIKAITKSQRDRYLSERGVKALGGGLDEAPQAYKNIEEVIAAQRDLVDVIAKFNPKLVMMADDPGDD